MRKIYVTGNFDVEMISRANLPLHAFYIEVAAPWCFFFFKTVTSL